MIAYEEIAKKIDSVADDLRAGRRTGQVAIEDALAPNMQYLLEILSDGTVVVSQNVLRDGQWEMVCMDHYDDFVF